MIATEDLKPGTRFRGNVNGAEMEIIKIESKECGVAREDSIHKFPVSVIFRDCKNGHTHTCGLEALRRCNITILAKP